MLQKVLISHRFPLLAALLGLMLALPALGTGWQIDDYNHRAVLLDPQRIPQPIARLISPRGAVDLFRFIDGPETVRRSLDLGYFPWWTVPEMRGVFFRPLAGVTHWLDYRLWPDSAPLMHAHTLGWLALLLAAAAGFYRRLPGSLTTAGLAALLFAVDDARAVPASWLANRNALPAALFGVLTLAAHDRWRRDGWRPGAVAGPLLFALSLLSAEAGVATVAYLIAHALFLDPAPWRSRLRALSPYLLLTLSWRLLSTHLGVGTSAMAIYVDPGKEPLRFLGAVLERAPLLLLGQWAPLPADTSMLVGATGYRMLWGVAAALIALLTVIFRPLLRRDPVARFLAAGMLLSLLPACAAFPDDRLLLFAGIGASGLLARFLTGISWRKPGAAPGTVRALALFLVLTHAVLAPILLPGRILLLSRLYARMYVPPLRDPAVARQSVILVNGPFVLFPCHLPLMAGLRGDPVPRHTRVLFPSFAGMTLSRTDRQTLMLRPEGGYLASPLDALFRDARRPLARGERVLLPDVTITVMELTPDGRPGAIACRFRAPLEAPSHRWLCWANDGYRPFTPPPVGATLHLPAVPLARLLR